MLIFNGRKNYMFKTISIKELKNISGGKLQESVSSEFINELSEEKSFGKRSNAFIKNLLNEWIKK